MKKIWLLSLVIVGLLLAGPFIGVVIANNHVEPFPDPVEDPVEDSIEEPAEEPCEEGGEDQDYREHAEDNDNDGVDDEEEVERKLITEIEPGVILT